MEGQMAEPTSTGLAATGFYKLGTALGLGVPFAAALVMIMQHPQSKREWAAALLATIAFSLFGGALVVQYFNLTSWLSLGFTGIVAVSGIIFACGLPGWVLVRAFFKYAERSKDKDILEIAKDVKDLKS